MRSDDGLAWRVADELEGKFPFAQVEIVRLPQLTPEVAQTASHFEFVIFVDAAQANDSPEGKPGGVRLEPIHPKSSPPCHFFHSLSPATVLSLTAQLYAAYPHAFSATLTGEDFSHGELLSPAVTAALPVLTGDVEALIRKILSGKAFPPSDPNKTENQDSLSPL